MVQQVEAVDVLRTRLLVHHMKRAAAGTYSNLLPWDLELSPIASYRNEWEAGEQHVCTPHSLISTLVPLLYIS